MKRAILTALLLAAAGAGAADAQCYLFTANGASLKVDITSLISTIGPITAGNTRSTNYTFLAINTLTVGGTTQVSSGFGQGLGGGASFGYTGGSTNLTTVVFLLADPTGASSWGVTLQGAGDLTPQGLSAPLPPISSWTFPIVGMTHDYIAVGSAQTAKQYQITSISSCAAAGPPNITISLSQLLFSFVLNGTLPAPQIINITNSGTGSFTWFAVADVPWLILAASSSTPTRVVQSVSDALAVGPRAVPVGTSPGAITVSLDPTQLSGLSPGPHVGHISINAAGVSNSPVVIPVSLNINPAVTGPTRTISHIANGASWRTTGILINTGTQAESFELKFWDNSGNPLVLNLGADGMTADLVDTIQPGVARFIRTAGTGKDLQQGWAELTAPLDIDGNSIFGLQTPGQGDSEAAVPLSPSSGTELFVPFDYTTGYSTGIAFANPGQQFGSVSATILDDIGSNVPASNNFSVPAHGHFSGVLADHSLYPGVVGKRGVAHFSSTASIAGLGIRANGKAFTSIEALTGVTSANKIIPHIASGGGWKTTFLIVCAGSQASNFTLSFWSNGGTALTLPLGADGTVSSITDLIEPGEVRIIQTTGTGPTVQGWAQLTGLTGAVSGTAIFALQSPGQSDSEAAVPFSTTASTHLYMPYDYTTGYSTAVAFANTTTNQLATVSFAFTDDGGHLLGSGIGINIQGNGHAAAVLGTLLPAIAGTRGTVSITSNVPIVGLGIRADGVAFTSLKVINK